MSSNSLEQILSDWQAWSDDDREGIIEQYLLHPWENGWYETCRYLIGKENWQSSESILSDLTKYADKVAGYSIEGAGSRWCGDCKSEYLELSFRCAEVLATTKSRLTNDLDSGVKEKLKECANNCGLPFSMAKDFACYLLNSSIEESLPKSREYRPLRCGVSFVDRDNVNGMMATLEMQLVPNNEQGCVYPHLGMTMITLREDFGEQIERAQRLVEQHGWPEKHDIRWNIIWEHGNHKPHYLTGPSLGMPFAYLLRKAVDNALRVEHRT